MITVQDAVNAFNNLYPIGTRLWVSNADGTKDIRTLLSQAWAVGNGAFVKFEGIQGACSVSRVIQSIKWKQHDLGFGYYVPCSANGEFL